MTDRARWIQVGAAKDRCLVGVSNMKEKTRMPLRKPGTGQAELAAELQMDSYVPCWAKEKENLGLLV